MKTVIDTDGNEIQVADDTIVKTINGIHYLLTSEEQTEYNDRQTAWTADTIKRTALQEIIRLEGEVTQRRLREATLGTDNGWLANQELLIAAERIKL